MDVRMVGLNSLWAEWGHRNGREGEGECVKAELAGGG
jgi:hypothetical protein